MTAIGSDLMEENDAQSTVIKLDSRVDEIEKQLPVINEKFNNMNALFQKNIAVLDKLEESFQDNRLVMQAMTNSIENSGKEIAGMKKDISALKEERNLNIMAWLKNNFVSIATLLTILGCFMKKLF